VTEAAFGKPREGRMVEAIRASGGYVPELSLVAPHRQRKGIGSALVREALRLADGRGEPLVLVLGHPSYYSRFGFRPASEIGIRPPDPEIPDAAFMAAELRSYDPKLHGRVLFPPAYSVE